VTAVRGEDGLGTGLSEEDLGDPGECPEAILGHGLRVVQGVDEDLAEDLGDVALAEATRVAADAAAWGGAALPAAGRLRLGLGRVVDEAERAAGDRRGATVSAVRLMMAAGGLVHDQVSSVLDSG
jgi:hypothetical protein